MTHIIQKYAPSRVQSDRKAGPAPASREEGLDQVEASVNPDFDGAYPFFTLVPCEACRTEGRIYTTRYGGNDPDWIDCGPCPHCDGTGEEIIEAEPIEEEDCWI